MPPLSASPSTLGALHQLDGPGALLLPIRRLIIFSFSSSIALNSPGPSWSSVVCVTCALTTLPKSTKKSYTYEARFLLYTSRETGGRRARDSETERRWRGEEGRGNTGEAQAGQ